MLIHKPPSMPWEVAAGIPETWITAIQAMYLIAGFTAGKSILWHAGASSVSIAGIQLSKAHGASAIYATAGSQDKLDLCKSLGATEAWNYRETDWAEQVDLVTDGKGVDIIIDFVGADYFQKNMNSVALDGRLVIVGLLSGGTLPAGLDITAFVRRRIRIEGSRLRSRSEDYQGKLRDMLVREALPGLRDGNLKVPIEKVFDWNDVQEAHQMMESNRNRGKIVCKVAVA
jgi:NADPH:quinone reductase-like Zn-dependent oxidoreductase